MHGLSQEDSSLTMSEVDFESDMRWESGLAFGEFGDISEQSERQEVLARLLERYRS